MIVSNHLPGNKFYSRVYRCVGTCIRALPLWNGEAQITKKPYLLKSATALKKILTYPFIQLITAGVKNFTRHKILLALR